MPVHGGVGLTTVTDVDVTSAVTFESSNSAAATVVGSTLTGVAPGTTEVSIVGVGVASAAATVTVTDEAITVNRLDVLLVTGAKWGVEPNIAAATSEVYTASVKLLQELNNEGDQGFIYTWVGRCRLTLSHPR